MRSLEMICRRPTLKPYGDLLTRDDYPGVIGVRWNQGQPNPALQQINFDGDCVIAPPTWFDQHPIYGQIKRCNLSDAGVINAFYGDGSFSYTGANGQVMVRHPKMFYRSQKSGNEYEWYVGDERLNNFKVQPGFVTDGRELDAFFLGAFEASIYDVTASATEVNTLTITQPVTANGNITLALDGNYVFTVALTTASDTVEKVVDAIVAAGAKTDYQGVVWTPTKVDTDKVRYTAGASGLKTTLARVIPTLGAIGSGTVAAADATTLTCTGKTWTVNGWAGYICRILTGTGAGSIGIIASNTATVLTVADWLVGADPDVGSTFEITPTGVAGVVAKTTSGAGGYVKNDSAGVDLTATTGDKLCSIAGVKPVSGWNNSITLPNFRTLAQNRGAGWNLMNFNQVSAVHLLYLIKYATFNSQTAIGAGVTAITDATAGTTFNNAINTGFTAGIGTNGVDLGNSTGECPLVTHYKTAEAAKANSLFGEENLFGNLWKWTDGINIKANYMPWIADHDFASDLFAHPYVDTGLVNGNTNGYPTNIGFGAGLDYGFLPSAVGGSSSTYLCDYYYQATGNMTALMGGYWTNGAIAGAFDWNLLNAASCVDWRLGARLSFFI